MDALEPGALRPLDIGEIFDRAVTVYVRNFVVFTLIMLTLSLPFGVLQYAASPAKDASLQQFVATFQASLAVHGPRAAAPPVAPSLSQYTGLIVLALLALLLTPFATNAIAAGVGLLYAGKAPQFGASFAAVFRRWPQILGLLGLWLLVAVAAYIAVAASLIVFGAVAMLVVRLGPLPAVIVVIIAVCVLLALMVLAVMTAIAAAFSFYATVIEKRRVTVALRSGFARIFNRDEFWKAVLIALAYGAIQLGVSILSLVVALAVLALTKSSAVEYGVSAIISALVAAFTTVLLAVYYYDVRIRREGFDLEADVQRLNA